MDVSATTLDTLQQALLSRNYNDALAAESVPLVQAMLGDLVESERKRKEIKSKMQQIQREQTQLKKNLSGLQRLIADRYVPSEVVVLKPPAHTSDLNVDISSNCCLDCHGHQRHNSFNSNPRSMDEDEDVFSCSINELFGCGANFRARHFSQSSHRESRTPIDDATAEQLSSLKLCTFFGVEMEDDTKTAVRHLVSNTARSMDPPSDAPVDEKAAASLSSMKMREFFGVERPTERSRCGRLQQTAHHLSNNQQRHVSREQRVHSRPPKAMSARARDQSRRRAHKSRVRRSPKEKLKTWFKSSSCHRTPNQRQKSANSKRRRYHQRKQNRSCDIQLRYRPTELQYDFSNLLCDDYDADYEDVDAHSTPRGIHRLRNVKAKQNCPRRQRLLSDPTTPSKRSIASRSVKSHSPIDHEDLVSRLALDSLHCDARVQSGPADLRRSTPTDYLSPMSGACIISPRMFTDSVRSPSSGSGVANARNSLLMNRSRSCSTSKPNSSRAKKMHIWKE